MQNDTDIMLTTKEAAAILGVSPDVLHVWRYRGIGPKYNRYERSIRYKKSDIDHYMATASVETKSHAYMRREDADE